MTTHTAIRHHRTPLLLSVIVLLLTSVLAAPGLAQDDHTPDTDRRGQALGRHAPGLGAELAAVRTATARYHDVEVALSDGFVAASPCVEGPEGAMGFHYVHEGRFGQLDPTLPQALLYIPGPRGQLRLVGVEYLHPAGGEVLGQALTHASPLGPETALHVWLWRHNPAGMFAPYNPKLSCG
jgi:hypothetical protein